MLPNLLVKYFNFRQVGNRRIKSLVSLNTCVIDQQSANFFIMADKGTEKKKFGLFELAKKSHYLRKNWKLQRIYWQRKS